MLKNTQNETEGNVEEADRKLVPIGDSLREAIKAARAVEPEREELAGRLECEWQRGQLPDAIGELVFDDQRLRNDICWSVFDC